MEFESLKCTIQTCLNSKPVLYGSIILSYSHLGFAPPSYVEVIQGDCDPLPRFPPEHVLTVRDRGVHAGVIRGRETPHFL